MITIATCRSVFSYGVQRKGLSVKLAHYFSSISIITMHLTTQFTAS